MALEEVANGAGHLEAGESGGVQIEENMVSSNTEIKKRAKKVMIKLGPITLFQNHKHVATE
jgi:hypothetical protein